MVRLVAEWEAVNDMGTMRSLKLVLIESGIGDGLPQISDVPPLVALKVCMYADTPSTMKKMVLLSQESIL